MRTMDDSVLMYLALARKKYLFTANPVPVQKKLLLGLVRKSQSTVFGRKYKFGDIRACREFITRVPPSAYSEFQPYINAIIEGTENVLFPGRPVCFGRTTGTDGVSKQIPLNRSLLRNSRMSAVDAALLGGLAKGTLRWHSGKTLYIGPRKGSPLGRSMIYSEGTAFAYLQSRFMVKRFVPEYQMLPEADEPQDHALLTRLSFEYKPKILAGHPVEMAHFLGSTQTKFPDVDVVFNCGCWAQDFNPIYQKALPNAHVIDVYGTNEGTWGLPVKPGIFLLNFQRVVFTFLPINEGEPAVMIDDVVPGRKYEMCVTTGGGLWNYRTGDIVMVLSITPALIRLCGRTSRILNINGEMVTENEVVLAVKSSSVHSLNYYLTNEHGRYILYTDDASADANHIHQELCVINKTYGQLRNAGVLPVLKVICSDDSVKKSKKPIRIL